MPYKILQITNKPPFPEIDGGSLEISKMSKFYDGHPDFELDILTVATYKHPFIKTEFEKNLRNGSSIKSVFIKTKPNILSAIKNLVLNKSYHLIRFKNKSFEKQIIQLLTSKKYDFVQCESIYAGQYHEVIKNNSSAKLILNTPNVEHHIWNNISKNSTFLKKTYFNILSKQLKHEEEEIWRKMEGVISISSSGKDRISAFLEQSKIISLPFYLDNKKYNVLEVDVNKEISFFHIGAMDWMPNVEGIKWFINSVWKELNLPNKLNLAGKNMPNSLLSLSNKSILCEGFVPDAKKYMMDHDVMVVPLLSGSGIRIKIIEAMALGKCIISTTIGAEGIDCTPNENILIADNPEEFSIQIKKVIANPSLISEIGKNAKKLAESNYDISNMEKILVPFLTQMLKS